MNNTLTDIDIKSIEVNILDYIDAICNEHDIPYFLDYGTLLGAVRHKGFIPWDDDVDICMKRADYDRFVQIASQQNKNSRYKILTNDIDPTYHYEFAKVVDSETILKEDNVLECANMGVWVDIFPKDRLPRLYKLLRIGIVVFFVCRIFSVYKKFPKKHNKLFYPVWIISKMVGFKPFLKLTSYLCRLGNKNKNSKYLCALTSLTSKCYIWDNEIFEESTLLEFEGKKYPAPKLWDKYLSMLYGDYMVIPPKSKQVHHNISVMKRYK